MFVAQFAPGAEEVKSFPVANPGLKLNAEQMREPEDGRALALRVGVDRIRQHIRVVLDQIDRRQVAFVNQRHVTEDKLNEPFA